MYPVKSENDQRQECIITRKIKTKNEMCTINYLTTLRRVRVIIIKVHLILIKYNIIAYVFQYYNMFYAKRGFY